MKVTRGKKNPKKIAEVLNVWTLRKERRAIELCALANGNGGSKEEEKGKPTTTTFYRSSCTAAHVHIMGKAMQIEGPIIDPLVEGVILIMPHHSSTKKNAR